MPAGGFDANVIRSAYEAVVDKYAATFGEDLAQLELDRRVLDAVAERCGARGVVLDVGCGPAHIALMVEFMSRAAVVRSVEGAGGWSRECPAAFGLASERSGHLAGSRAVAWLETGTASPHQECPPRRSL
jgi:hypothetical protein